MELFNGCLQLIGAMESSAQKIWNVNLYIAMEPANNVHMVSIILSVQVKTVKTLITAFLAYALIEYVDPIQFVMKLTL